MWLAVSWMQSTTGNKFVSLRRGFHGNYQRELLFFYHSFASICRKKGSSRDGYIYIVYNYWTAFHINY